MQAKLKFIAELAEKDNKIENLQNNLQLCKRKIQSKTFKELVKAPRQFQKESLTSAFTNKTVRATSGKRHHTNITKSREDIISYVSIIPSFDSSNVKWITLHVDNLGDGEFGEIKQVQIKTLNIVVAAKVPKIELSKMAMLAETIVLLTLSGHINFPFCFGLLSNKIVLMEYFGSFQSGFWKSCQNFSQKQRSGMTMKELKDICKGVLNAIIFLHDRHILHNDIKADNIVIANEIKMIDFGKATMLTSPLEYNIAPGTAINSTYNTIHRHIAHELRNVPGSKQSIKTGIYSVGYMFKHAAAKILFKPIIELGRLMKHCDIDGRISTQNALDKLTRL